MAEKETKNQPKDLVEAVPEEIEKLEKELPAEEVTALKRRERRPTAEEREREAAREAVAKWAPKTELGRKVKAGKEKDIDSVLSSGKKILEPEIADSLLNLSSDLLAIGQAKGKFGGGKRRAWRQTQKKTMEGNVVTFSAMAVVGDKKGRVGIGYGKGKETLPARAKAIREAKLNITKVIRGCGSFDCSCNELHSIPFSVEGKCGSVRIKLMPAPQGTGLVVGDEVKKIMRLAGIKDIYGIAKGQTRTTFNLAKACIDALKKTSQILT